MIVLMCLLCKSALAYLAVLLYTFVMAFYGHWKECYVPAPLVYRLFSCSYTLGYQ